MAVKVGLEEYVGEDNQAVPPVPDRFFNYLNVHSMAYGKSQAFKTGVWTYEGKKEGSITVTFEPDKLERDKATPWAGVFAMITLVGLLP